MQPKNQSTLRHVGLGAAGDLTTENITLHRGLFPGLVSDQVYVNLAVQAACPD